LKTLDFSIRWDQNIGMGRLILTEYQKKQLEVLHSQARDSRESDRIKAILLRAEGWKLSMIAQALRKHENTIAQHIRDYIQKEKLRPENGGSTSQLSGERTQKLIGHLTDNTYPHQKDIIIFIQKTWGIEFSVPGINKWLHKNGFSYKKPKNMPYKVDLEKQEAFKKAYEQLKSELAEDDSIYFMDAVHPTQATKVSSGWIRTGTDKPIKTTGSRTRINIVGAIRLGHLAEAVTAQYKTVNGESIMKFMDKLRNKHDNKGTIHLILDGAGYHKSAVVKEKAEKLNITLHILPPYSPNLNPIERLWKVMNEKVRNNRCFHSAEEFRQHINHFFDDILPDIGASLDSRINDNFQKFDPALLR